MKNLCCRSLLARRLSVSLLLAGVGLLSCGPIALAANPDEKRSSAAPAAKAQGSAGKAVAPGATATRPALATVSAGKFKIAVEGVRWAKGEHTPSLEYSGLPVSANLTTDGKGASGVHGASGGSGGASGGGGSGAAGTAGRAGRYVPAGVVREGGAGWSAGGGGSGGAGGSGGYSAGGSGASGGYSAGGSGGSGTSSRSGGAGARGGSGGGFSSGGGSGGYSASGGSSSSGGHSAGGSSAGGGGAAAGGSGGKLSDVNLVIDLRVSGPKTGRNQLLGTVVGKVQAEDDQGKAIDAPDLPAHLKMQLSDFEYPQDSGCASVHLNIENKDAKSIKSLTGELVVMDARIQTTAFEGRALNTVSTRQLIGVKVHLDKVKTTEEGIDVSAGVSMPNPFTDQLNFHNMQNRLRVVLEDSEGTIHTPRSGSGGGGGGGGGGSSSSTSGSDSMRRGGRGNGPGQSLPPAIYNLNFAPLPQGVSIKRITCTVTELLGTPQRVAFRFSDLPLPQAAPGARE